MPKIKGSQIRNETVTGDQILNESIDENDIKDGSIKAAELSSEAITGQTLHSGSTDDLNDMLLIYDHSNTDLRKIPLSDLMGPSGLDNAIEDVDQDTGISVDNGSDEDKIRFRTANLERAIIDNAGNFGIGTSSPSSKLDVSGNVNVSGDLDVSNVATYNTVEYFNSNTMKFNQYYLGNANGSYFSANEYQKVLTIIPSSNSENYQVIGRITAQNAGETHVVYFNAALRSGDPLPDLSWSIFYDEEYNGSRYIDPQLWTKETTTAGFIFAFKTLGTIYGNVTVDIDVVPRASSQKSNVSINTSVSSEQTSIDAGYTANDMTKVIRKQGQSVTAEGNLTVYGSVATNTIDANGDLTLDTSGGQIYMKDDGITYLTFNVDGITDSIDAVGNLNLNATGDITINASGGDIKFEDNGVRRLTIEDGGNIGVGNLIPNPGFHLHLKKSTTSPMLYIDNIATDDTDFIYAKSSMDSDPDAGSYLLRWADSVSDTLYYVRGNGIGGSTVSTSFTAGHDTIMEITETLLPGMIVESTGVIWYKPTELTFETALPKCRLTSSAMSNKVFGVIGGVPAVDEASKSFQESGGKIVNGFLQSPAFSSYGRRAGVSEQEVHLNTMSIGEGVIWVTNINGEVRNGDLICSSDIIGHGQLQNDDIMRSITVAKCTEDIPWNSISDVIEFNGAFYKKYLAACTFHCG